MKILIAEDDSVTRRVLEVTLAKWGYEVIVARDGDEALAALQSTEAPPLAILDWMMPGKDGIEVCGKVRQSPSATPTYIILLTAKTEKEDVVAGLDAGADDYLTKPFERSELRARIEVGVRVVNLQKKLAKRVEELNLALVELKKAEAEVRNLSMTDDLTDLYNRRGFLILSQQQQKVARRIKKPFSLIYADMDGLKKINDTYGHQEGSEAIKQIAQILKKSFRESDIIARLGGDEFTIFVTDMNAGNIDIPLERLMENLSEFNRQNLFVFQLSLSLGVMRVEPEDDSLIEELLVRADKAMYENKRQKQQLNKAAI
jgi:diguanylate cyclase (GGDEF)-like protein